MSDERRYVLRVLLPQQPNGADMYLAPPGETGFVYDVASAAKFTAAGAVDFITRSGLHMEAVDVG